MTDMILRKGRITTLDPDIPAATAVAIKGGQIETAGTDHAIMSASKTGTPVIDLNRRRVIPGLNDSHTRLSRCGLSYNIELRWENKPSKVGALAILRRQTTIRNLERMKL